MSQQLPDPFSEAIAHLEREGRRMAMLERIRRWEGLTVEQRAIAYTFVVLRCPPVDVVASAVGLPDARVVEAFAGRGGPLESVRREDGSLELVASEKLAYGDEGGGKRSAGDGP